MTDRYGRRARWTALFAIAPGTAALFGGAVWWAVETAPASQSAATSQTPAATTPPAPARAYTVAADFRLRKIVRTNSELERRIQRLRSEWRQLASQRISVPTVSYGGGGSTYTGGSSSTYYPPAAPQQPSAPQQVYVPVQQPAQAPPPPPVAAPAPAPPPVHATSGASGAKH